MRSFSFAERGGERLFKVVLNVTPTAINKCVWQDFVKQDKMIDRGKVALRDAIDHQKWFWLLRRALGVGRVMSIHSFIQHFQLMGPSNHIDPLINWSMNIVFCFRRFLNIFWTLVSLGFPSVSVWVHNGRSNYSACSRTGRVRKNHNILRKNTTFNKHPVNYSFSEYL